MSNGLLLWVDDEIELLRAHLLFLEKKGYEVVTVSNGTDAIDMCRTRTFDLILLDEMMPGLSGLETLQKIKELSPATPVVMVTKSEEEDIMNQAIGSKIADYLIKPVNPNQILLSLKKNIHRKEIVTEVTQSGYQQNFQDISSQIDECKTYEDWMNVYKRLVHWELELSNADSSMTDMLAMQKEEADNGFAKFIKKNYLDWIVERGQNVAANSPGSGMPYKGHYQQVSRMAAQALRQSKSAGNAASATAQLPLMSPDIFKKRIFPLLDKGEKVFMVV
ncbi:MAG: response regulator, partial [Prevotella sp.]|nr:response regulator [Prevotella sp.]